MPFATGMAQKLGRIEGLVKEANTGLPIIGAVVAIEKDSAAPKTVTDAEGRFVLRCRPGSYNIKASFPSFLSVTQFNILVTTGNAAYLTFSLEEAVKATGEVTVTQNQSRSRAYRATLESPLSIQGLTVEEIKSNPGGNFDISKAIQVLPGVGTSGAASTGGVRNDIIIRGGAPNENVYYLDGIELPIINHFSTQGSAGGSNGILNTFFLEDVQFNSSAFGAQYDNALSSVFNFRQREGNRERLQGNVRLAGTELGLQLDGPLGPKTSYLFSIRRSYLQFLFDLLDQPILPSYWDSQFKISHRIDNKTTLNFIGVGALDDFRFRAVRKSDPDKEYNLRSLPTIKQQSYTIGVSLNRSLSNGTFTVALSQNYLGNQLERFEDGRRDDPTKLALRTDGKERETKLRINTTQFLGPWKITYGGLLQYTNFNNDNFVRLRNATVDSLGTVVAPPVTINSLGTLNFWRYGIHGQVSRYFLGDRLSVSFGLRTDMNSFTTTGNNPLRTLSPRVATSYAINDQLRLNASYGIYYKAPINTILSFRDNNGNFANRDALYTRSIHYVTGFEYLPRESTRLIIEGFYKQYSNYAVSVFNNISLANLGTDFTALGNEKVRTNGQGEAVGVEFSLQQKLKGPFFYTLSYTLVNSRFDNGNGKLIASAWDLGHIGSAILGIKLPRNWEIGLKYRVGGGSPYTPFDLQASRANYLLTGQGVLDFTRLNTLRTRWFHQVDFRIDKKVNWKNLSLDFYIDITNLLAFRGQTTPQYTFKRTEDNSGFQTTDNQPLQQNGSNALPIFLTNDDPFVLRTFGFILEF